MTFLIENYFGLSDDLLRGSTGGHNKTPCSDATVVPTCSDIEAKVLVKTLDRLLHIFAGH